MLSTLTRLVAHYPNCGHNLDSLKIVSEDWCETFAGKISKEAFADAVNRARRASKFFLSEKDVLDAAVKTGYSRCDTCSYNEGKKICANLSKEGFDPTKCKSYKDSDLYK